MKTQHSILGSILGALISVTSTLSAQPAFSLRPAAAEQHTVVLWQQFAAVESSASHSLRLRLDPADLDSYEAYILRHRVAAERYATLDSTGADPVLAAHIKECATSHRGMAQAFRRARHEFVPAFQSLIPDLQKSPHAIAAARKHGLDLFNAGLTEETISFVSSLVGDKRLASESRYIAVQCRLVSEAAASFQQAEQRLRDSQAAHEKVALVLSARYGPAVAEASRPMALWAW